MRILVTGGSGFVGETLKKRLKKDNIYYIHNKKKINGKNHFNCNLINEDDTKHIIRDIKPEIILHLAALKGPKINDINKKLAYEANILITENIIRNINNSCHLIFNSSDVVYNGENAYPNEKSKLKPRNYHGALKIKCEDIIQKYINNYTILRISTIYDDKLELIKINKDDNFVNKAIYEIYNNNEVEIFSNIYRCFTNVNKLVILYLVLLKQQRIGIYNVGSTMKSYSNLIKSICNKLKLDESKINETINNTVEPKIQNMDLTKVTNDFNILFD